jgi:predicted RNase H-like HicB family nuclease
MECQGGEWVITIKELPDFFAAGSKPGEAALNSREALLSHLAGYLAVGKRIPTPAFKSDAPHTSATAPSLTQFENA